MKKRLFGCGIIVILIIFLVLLTGCTNTEDTNNIELDSAKQSTGTSKTGILSKIVTAENYGDKVEYSVNGIEDWKIFYNDGENVFIIASEIIPNSKISQKLGLESDKYVKNFNVIWDWDNQEFLKYKGVSSIDKNVAEKYQLEWITNHTEDTDNKNVKVVASLLEQSNWNDFVDSEYADSAIGGPTLEMFVKSWNDKGHTKLYYNNSNEYGYNIGLEDKPTTNAVYGYNFENSEEFKSDSLYAVETDITDDGGDGYWIASPNARGSDRICQASGSNIGLGDPFGDYAGVRPVVCLNTNVNGQLSENNIWKLSK